MFVSEALKAIDQKVLQESQFITASLGAIGVTVATAAGAKNAKMDWYDFVPVNLKSLSKPNLKISVKTAKIFVDLLKRGKVPSWVLKLVDVKGIIEVANG